MILQADSQKAFSSAIRSPGTSVPSGLLEHPEGKSTIMFNVYRNNHVVGLSDALGMSFPVVKQLVGEKFFESAAFAYIQKHPPTSPVLLLYGDLFADFLTTLPGIARVAYVVDVARLEWARIFSLNAADAAPIPVQTLADIDSEMLGSVHFKMHPSLQVLSSNWPVLSIWQDCQHRHSEKVDLSSTEKLMLVRSGFDLNSWRLTAGEHAFVNNLFNGETLGKAAEAASLIDEDFDLAEQLALVFQRGAVAGINPN